MYIMMTLAQMLMHTKTSLVYDPIAVKPIYMNLHMMGNGHILYNFTKWIYQGIRTQHLFNLPFFERFHAKILNFDSELLFG